MLTEFSHIEVVFMLDLITVISQRQAVDLHSNYHLSITKQTN